MAKFAFESTRFGRRSHNAIFSEINETAETVAFGTACRHLCRIFFIPMPEGFRCIVGMAGIGKKFFLDGLINGFRDFAALPGKQAKSYEYYA